MTDHTSGQNPTVMDTPVKRPVLRVGCAMWAHRPWVGPFYPATVKSGRELAEYVTWCNAVEGNTTFYGQPSTATIQRWIDMSPPDFRFAFKLPRTITHDKRLRDVRSEVRGFLDAIEPMGTRVGPVQVQLPGSFGPDSVDVLLAFLRRLPLDWPWAIELRHPGFFDGSSAHRRIDDLLVDREITRVVLDTRPLYGADAVSPAAVDERRAKPHLPVLLDAVGPHPIVRVIGEDRVAATMAGLRTWIPTVVAWLAEGREPYVFAHQPENLESPRLARSLHAEVAEHVKDLVPLPEPHVSTMF